MTFDSKYWAVILGGSSGFGLATAQKLSRHGMNICIVHRDRKGAMKRIEPEFDAIRKTGVELRTFNVNALSQEGMSTVVDDLTAVLSASGGRVRMLLHSIAYGNLKLLAPIPDEKAEAHNARIGQLAERLGVDAGKVQTVIDELFEAGTEALAGVATPAVYKNEDLLHDEDFALTVFSMGTSLASWVHEIWQRDLFCADARILGLTSEGNEVAWRGYAAVSAAKVALEAVARSIAVEYAPYGLRANIVQAGVTDTPALRLIPGNQHLQAAAKMRNPFNRITTPKDVANFVYLMCLDEAAWLTGNIIRVDGGEHISG